MAWRDRFARLGRSNEQIASDERHQVAVRSGADAIAEASDRSRVTLRGSIEVLTVRPRRHTPWLEGELSDGTGRVTLIWMGRHEIPGIEAGRELVVHGRISAVDGGRRIYNPSYELV